MYTYITDHFVVFSFEYNYFTFGPVLLILVGNYGHKKKIYVQNIFIKKFTSRFINSVAKIIRIKF